MLFDLITHISGKYRTQRPSLCSLLQPVVTSSHLDPVSFPAPYSQTPSAHVPPSMSEMLRVCIPIKLGQFFSNSVQRLCYRMGVKNTKVRFSAKLRFLHLHSVHIGWGFAQLPTDSCFDEVMRTEREADHSTPYSAAGLQCSYSSNSPAHLHGIRTRTIHFTNPSFI
jgi:hypothetical protein